MTAFPAQKPSSTSLEKELLPIKKSEFNFSLFRNFILIKAIEDSLELKQFDAALEVQGYILRSAKRKRFFPQLAGIAFWNHTMSDTNLGPARILRLALRIPHRVWRRTGIQWRSTRPYRIRNAHLYGDARANSH